MDVADNQYEASQVLGSDVAAAIEPLNHGSVVRRRCPSRLLTPDGARLTHGPRLYKLPIASLPLRLASHASLRYTSTRSHSPYVHKYVLISQAPIIAVKQSSPRSNMSVEVKDHLAACIQYHKIPPQIRMYWQVRCCNLYR